MRYALLGCLGLLAGCTTMPMAREQPDAGIGGNGTRIATNLPCDVNAVLVANCQSCHGLNPSGGAPMSLVTYADLAAPARSDPSQTVAAMCVARITSATAPMPPSPSPSLSAADVATIQNWVGAGMPMGDCTSGPDSLGAAPTCTSGQTWSGDEGSRMDPGQACISCHQRQGGEAPIFAIAGTVYPTGHEPDNCLGTSAVQVIITDANGVKLPPLTPNSSGNFSSRASIALPYHAEVVANGLVRAMSAAQSTGDCNSCHTQFGANGAPGRITAP